MNNRLIKSIRSEFVPGSPGVPAIPGQPYVPARRVTEYRQVCAYQQDWGALERAGWTRVWTPGYSHLGVWYDGSWRWVPPEGWEGDAVEIPWSYQCHTEPYVVEYPEQPYRPPTPAVPPTDAQQRVDYNIGWTGRARSVASVGDAQTAEFSVTSSTVGAVVGLSSTSADTGYADMPYAFYVAGSVWQIVESGQTVTAPAALATNARLSIARLGGRVRYAVDGVVVRDVVDEAAPTTHLTAALYMGGDEVYDPVIRTTSHASGGAVRANAYVVSFDAEPTDWCFGRAVVSARGALGGTAAGGAIGIASAHPRLTWGTDSTYCEGAATAVARTALGDAGATLLPQHCAGMAIASLRSASGTSYTPGTAAGIATTMRIAWGADTALCFGGATAAARDAYGRAVSRTELLHNMAQMATSRARSIQVLTTDIAIVLTSGASVASVFAYQIERSTVLMSSAHVDSVQVLQSIINMVLLSGANAKATGTSGDDVAVWTVNAETGASTRYENYPFNSFAFFDGAYYGCRSDGVYRLEGDTDNGAPIQAMMSFGKRDFGTSALKQVTHVYAGLSSGGRLFLKTIVNGEEYTYVARSSSEDLRQQRFDLGRGLRANYLEFELYNADGDDFELASVEFLVVPLNRRI